MQAEGEKVLRLLLQVGDDDVVASSIQDRLLIDEMDVVLQNEATYGLSDAKVHCADLDIAFEAPEVPERNAHIQNGPLAGRRTEVGRNGLLQKTVLGKIRDRTRPVWGWEHKVSGEAAPKNSDKTQTALFAGFRRLVVHPRLFAAI